MRKMIKPSGHFMKEYMHISLELVLCTCPYMQGHATHETTQTDRLCGTEFVDKQNAHIH